MIYREDEVRRVASRPPWIWEGAFVEENYVRPPHVTQMTNEAVANNTGTNYDTFCLLWEFAHC